VSFGPANAVTSVRAVLVAGLALLLIQPRLPPAGVCAAVAAVAAALDGLDGWLARRTRTESAFGARFDMETDAALILVLSALVVRYGKAGSWVLAAGLMRYAFIAAGAVWPWLQRPLEPSRRRQTMCVVQIAGLVAALLPAVTLPASEITAAAATSMLAWSFLVDILWLWRWRASRPLFSSSTRP
jgi:phosphatidylglycerophosphate synthase